MAWALANPLTAAPDEPAHATKAAAVVRGELVGAVYNPEHPGWGHVTVPAVVAFTTQMPNCFAFKPNVPASCLPHFPQDVTAPTQAVSTASAYNPTYYAFVGLPSLFPTGAITIYLMRIASALLCALALAWGMTQALTLRRGSWLGLGVVVALTPMVAFLSGSINPASLEIACAVALWVSLGAIIADPDSARLRSRIAGISIIASVFVNLRGLSPLFLAIIVGSSVLASPWFRTWAVIRDRRTWPWLGLVAAASAAALAWIRFAGSLDSDGIVHHPDLTFWVATQWSLGDTSVYLTNMLGQFGWVDTNLPVSLLVTIAIVIGWLVLMGLVLGTTRERTVMLLLAVATITIPVAIHAWQAKYLGIVWQGRYFLPAAVGLPILASFAIARATGPSWTFAARRTTALLGAMWVAYQAVAFAINLHRYQVGHDGSWRPDAVVAWSPPLPVWLLGGLLAAGLFGTLRVIWVPSDEKVDPDDPILVESHESLPLPGAS